MSQRLDGEDQIRLFGLINAAREGQWAGAGVTGPLPPAHTASICRNRWPSRQDLATRLGARAGVSFAGVARDADKRSGADRAR
jgi:hypothetical protein